MEFRPLPLSGAYLIDLTPRRDSRGFFARLFCEDEMRQHGLSAKIAQMNNSLSAQKGTLRGLHYQLPPHAETKIVRCVRGAVWDCIVDLRPESPTFKQWHGAELSAENRTMMYVPKGFAHGFVTLVEDSELVYMVDEPYNAQSERGIRWNDPAFGITWPLVPTLVSERDQEHPFFAEGI